MRKSDVLNSLNTKDVNLIFLKEVDSTNNFLKTLAREGAANNTVVIAQTQTAGRGTKNRSFVSDFGGLYMSILLKGDFSFFSPTLITPMVAVAVCDAISRFSDKKPQIKWVNDVLIDQKKVCGILCESSLSPNLSESFVVVGIGINFFKPKQGFAEPIKNIATCLYDHFQDGLKERFTAYLIDRFWFYFDSLEKKEFIPKYRELSIVLDKEIDVIEGNSSYKAKALNIDDNCRLEVKLSDNSKKILSSADVSIRL